MSIAATIKALRSVGISDQQIVNVVLTMAEETLAKARARQAKFRNKKTIPHITNVSDVSDVMHVTPRHQKENTPTPPKENLKILKTQKENPPRGGQKKKAATLCPDDWHPAPKTIKVLIAEGKTFSQIETAQREMIDWSRGSGKLKHDWNATFRNWVRRNFGSGTLVRAPPSNPLAAAFASVGQELGQELGKQDEPDSQQITDITPKT